MPKDISNRNVKSKISSSEMLEIFRVVADDIDNQVTTFRIKTNYRDVLVNWKWKEIRDSENVDTRGYNHNLLEYCLAHNISMRLYNNQTYKQYKKYSGGVA